MLIVQVRNTRRRRARSLQDVVCRPLGFRVAEMANLAEPIVNAIFILPRVVYEPSVIPYARPPGSVPWRRDLKASKARPVYAFIGSTSQTW